MLFRSADKLFAAYDHGLLLECQCSLPTDTSEVMVSSAWLPVASLADKVLLPEAVKRLHNRLSCMASLVDKMRKYQPVLFSLAQGEVLFQQMMKIFQKKI